MNLRTAEAIIGGKLTHNSKMPPTIYSWGLDADHCIRGNSLARMTLAAIRRALVASGYELAPGAERNYRSVCEVCYAKRGHFPCPNVIAARKRRLDALEDPDWVPAMVFLVKAYTGVGWFRWFDAGDLQGVDHLAKIATIARKTPKIVHWLPTHEPFMVREYGLERLPENLTVRVSADYIEERALHTFGVLPSSTVHTVAGSPVPVSHRRKDSIECRAYTRDNNCGGCRACWDKRVLNVSYHQH